MMEEKTEKKKTSSWRTIHQRNSHPSFFSFYYHYESPLESHDQAVPYFFTRLPSSPLFSVFNVCFLLFLSLTLSLSTKGDTVTQGKIDSNISEIVIRSRSSHCSEIDGRVYVFAWVEGRERIHRE